MSEFAIFSTIVVLGQSEQGVIPSTGCDALKGIDPALVYLWLKKPR